MRTHSPPQHTPTFPLSYTNRPTTILHQRTRQYITDDHRSQCSTGHRLPLNIQRVRVLYLHLQIILKQALRSGVHQGMILGIKPERTTFKTEALANRATSQSSITKYYLIGGNHLPSNTIFFFAILTSFLQFLTILD